jgi:putative FmdB family regulatory protein
MPSSSSSLDSSRDSSLEMSVTFYPVGADPRSRACDTARMPVYEFRCRTCDTTFEARRPMAESNAAATCPDGHHDTVRLLSVFASVGAASPSASSTPSGGGAPCGAHCGCHG